MDKAIERIKEQCDIHAKCGLLGHIDYHLNILNRVLRGGDLPLNQVMCNIETKLDQMDNGLKLSHEIKDVFIPSAKEICKLPEEHVLWIKYISKELVFYKHNPCEHLNKQVVTKEKRDEVYKYFYPIEVPLSLWTEQYLTEKMSNIKTLLITGEWILNTLPVEKFTTIQAMNVVSKFTPVLYDEIRRRTILHNIRRDFSNGKCCICHRKKKSKVHSVVLNQKAFICKNCQNKVELLESSFIEYAGDCIELASFFIDEVKLSHEQASYVINLFSRWLKIK